MNAFARTTVVVKKNRRGYFLYSPCMYSCTSC